MKMAAEHEIDGAVNMTAEMHAELQVCLSDAESEATTWSITDTDRIVSQPETDIYGITLTEQMRFKKDVSIRMIEFEASWQAFGIE